MKKASIYLIITALFVVHRLFTFSESEASLEQRVYADPATVAVAEVSAPNDIQAGDLVFFQVSEKGRHVGIYLKDGVFLHASTKDGVTLNRMSDRYWEKRLIAIRRVEHDISLDELMQAYKRYDEAGYAYGRTGPDGFDCSGLVWRVFGNHGVFLPRATNEQLRTGYLVASGDEYLAQYVE